MYMLKAEDKSAFYAQLDKMGADYDPDECMVRREFTTRGYHTTMTGGMVHPIRESFSYAVALLDGGRDNDIRRAWDILRKVTPLQETDPAKKTYGIWSYYLEEPLEKMSPPDWNWADFNGKEIVYILRDHVVIMDLNLQDALTAALRNACMSIFRRNMDPGYTNISIMGTYVTLAAGELMGWNDMFEYGKSRLRHLHRHNMAAGGFLEYNSPGYTALAMTDLTRLAGDIQDAECRKLSGELCRMAWKTIAAHFHPVTGMWAGPNARNYNWLEDRRTWTLLQRAAGINILKGREPDFNMEWVRVEPRCPEEYLPYFSGEIGAHDASEALYEVSGDHPGRIEGKRLVAFSYIGNTYTFSSFARCDTWNQRRTLFGHFGTQDCPGYVGIRMLHDFYDFSSGMVASAQYMGTSMFVLNFVSDGGDTHCVLDMIKNHTIRAADMRFRVLAGGPAAEGLNAQWDGGKLDIALPGARLRLDIKSAFWDGAPPVSYEVTRDGDQTCFDIVLAHSDQPVEIHMNELGASFIAGCMSLDPNADPNGISVTQIGESVKIEGTAGIPLSAQTSAKPVPQARWDAEVMLAGVVDADYLDSR